MLIFSLCQKFNFTAYVGSATPCGRLMRTTRKRAMMWSSRGVLLLIWTRSSTPRISIRPHSCVWSRILLAAAAAAAAAAESASSVAAAVAAAAHCCSCCKRLLFSSCAFLAACRRRTPSVLMGHAFHSLFRASRIHRHATRD